MADEQREVDIETKGRGVAWLPEGSAGGGVAGWAEAERVNPREWIYKWLRVGVFGSLGRKCPWA